MIPVFKPCYDNREIEALKPVFESGWIGLGPKTKEFETKFSEYIGSKYAVGVNSATAALQLSLNCFNIKDKEVITTPLTFVSTNHAILYEGGIPVFCDVEEDTMNINANEIEKLITKKTAGVLIVHYGGRSCEMDKIKKICEKNNLFLIEDCAHATGGMYKNQMLGSIGDMGCFSFHAVKNIATADGGMITTNNKEHFNRMMMMRWLGITKDTFSRDLGAYSWYYDVKEIGFKCHMNDIIAAIGIVQLEKIEWMNERRREISDYYDNKLKGVGDIVPISKKDYQKISAHNYVIKTGKRDGLNNFLKGHNVSTGVHYYPNHLYDIYKAYYRNCPVAEREWVKLLTLPLYPDLKNSELDMIVEKIIEFYSQTS